MSDFKIIEPIEILEPLVGSGHANDVPEGDYAEWAVGTTYATGDRIIVTEEYGIFGESMDQVSRYWYGIAGTVQGNIYAAVYVASPPSTPGYIYIKASDDDTFKVVQGSASKFWWGMCVNDANGDVYAACFVNGGVSGDIYKQTGGSGTFASLSQTSRQWSGMCATGGHVFAAVYGGDIYKQTNGTGDFAALSIGNKNWTGMCATPAGIIYACVYNGDIWVSDDDGASFAAIADTDRDWYGVCSDLEGTVYAAVYNGGIYKRSGGAGVFAVTANATKYWTAIGFDPKTQDMYAAVGVTGDIWISRYLGGVDVHKIYESLVDSNTGNSPPSDVNAATPKWLAISATNKWKAFDGKIVDQMIKVSPAVYVLTPGEVFDSVALLNLDATSVTIATNAPAYSKTVSTGATDVVKFDLAGDAASILTITITNSGGSSKVGEIVVGNYLELGKFRPDPTVGIIDYSIKETDDFGNYSIVTRDYSKRMSCVVKVANTSMDAIFNALAGYRATALVWVGSTSYTSTIIYGYYKDFSIVIGYKDYSMCNLEIEGLT